MIKISTMLILMKRQLIEHFIIHSMTKYYDAIITRMNNNNIKQEQYDDIIDIIIFLLEKRHKSKYIIDVMDCIAFGTEPSSYIDALKQTYLNDISSEHNDIKISYDILRKMH